MQSAIDAERAFAKMAREKGQWTAFRYFAAADAVMFVPKPVNAQDWLRHRVNPSKSVEWSPTASYVSCGGDTTVNTGEWRRPDGSVGYFTTVWRRRSDGEWRWIMDHGDTLREARPPTLHPTVRAAGCSPAAWSPSRVYRFAGIQRPGQSADGSLRWYWRIHGFEQPLPREFLLDFWNGRSWENVITNDVAPAPKP